MATASHVSVKNSTDKKATDFSEPAPRFALKRCRIGISSFALGESL
jgi:hypothetical protein